MRTTWLVGWMGLAAVAAMTHASPEQRRQAEMEVEHARRVVEQLESGLRRLEAERDRLRRAELDLDRRRHELRRRLDAAEQRRVEAEIRAQSATVDLPNATDQLQRVRETHAQDRARRRQIEQELTELRTRHRAHADTLRQQVFDDPGLRELRSAATRARANVESLRREIGEALRTQPAYIDATRLLNDALEALERVRREQAGDPAAVELAARRVAEARKRISDLLEAAFAASPELTQARADADRLQGELELEIRRAEDRIGQDPMLRDLQSQIDALESRVRSAAVQEQITATALSDAQRRIDHLERVRNDARLEATFAEGQVRLAEQELRQHERSEQDLQRSKQRLDDDTRRLQRELDDARRRLADAERRLRELR